MTTLAARARPLPAPVPAARDARLSHPRAHAILGVFHYLPLYASGMGARFGRQAGDCPVTEDVSARLLRPPFYNDLSDELQHRIIGTVGCVVA